MKYPNLLAAANSYQNEGCVPWVAWQWIGMTTWSRWCYPDRSSLMVHCVHFKEKPRVSQALHLAKVEECSISKRTQSTFQKHPRTNAWISPKGTNGTTQSQVLLLCVSFCQVSLLPDPPVLAANTTTSLEVCYRPLLVGSSEAKLLLESPELGQYEWGLRITGAAGNPERSLGFSVPLGMRETQVGNWQHISGVHSFGKTKQCYNHLPWCFCHSGSAKHMHAI